MSGSARLDAALIDSVVVLALWSGVILGPRRARVPLALVSLACTSGLWFLAAGAHARTWTIVASGGAIAASIVLLFRAAELSSRDGGGGSGGEDGDGGLGRRPPERPTGGGGPAEPSWWPEFERDLRRYMAERASANQAARRQLERLLPR